MTTTNDGCEKWIELSDREALGDLLSRQELALMRAHEDGCPECSQEAAAFRSLSTGPLEAVPNDQQVEDILRAAAVAPAPRPASIGRPKRTVVLAAVVGLAAAAAALVFVRAREEGGASRLAHGPASLPAQASHGDTGPHTGSAPATVPPQLPEPDATQWTAANGPSCRVVLDDITVCLDRGGKARTGRLTGAQAVLELVQGRAVASLPPRPPKSSFAIETTAGTVKAVGTIFAVEVDTGGSTIARVLRGEVAVQAAGALVAQQLRAGQAMRVGAAGSVAPIPADERRRDLGLLGAESSAEAGTGAERNTVPRAGEDPLARARQLRAHGQFSRAAELYQSIHSANPKSSSGKAALLGLAELRLSDLGDAVGALKAFDAYLASGGGPLAREALYGRIRALRALGKRDQESAAIERFISTFPDGPEAQALRQRLELIRGR